VVLDESGIAEKEDAEEPSGAEEEIAPTDQEELPATERELAVTEDDFVEEA
jgi:hypothetical protein